MVRKEGKGFLSQRVIFDSKLCTLFTSPSSCEREADQEQATIGDFSEGATRVDIRILCQFCPLYR